MVTEDERESGDLDGSFGADQTLGQDPGGHRETRWVKLAIGLTVLFCVPAILAAVETARNAAKAPPGAAAVQAPTQRDLASDWVAYRSAVPYARGSLDHLAWTIKDSLVDLFATRDRTTVSGTPGGEVLITLRLPEGEYCVYYAQWDVASILKAIRESGYRGYTSVRLFGRTVVRDVYARGTDAEVLRAVYSRSVIDRIDWQAFEETSVYKIATGFWHDPRFSLL